MPVGKHFPNGIGDGESFEREKCALHPLIVIGRTLKNFFAR